MITIREARIAISYYCNLRCQHCYVPESNRMGYKTLMEPSQLEVEEIERFIDALFLDYGLEKISITGGEALLKVVWPRTKRIMQHAVNRGLQVRLITGGSGQISIDELLATCDDVSKLTLQVSLDGTSPDLVDKFRGTSGAFQRAIQTISTAVKEGLSVRVRYTVTEENFHETLPCYQLVSNIGVKEFVIKPVFDAGTARDNRQLLVTAEGVRNLQRALVENSRGNNTRVVLPQPCFLRMNTDVPGDANVQILFCECGNETLYLSTNGDIYPCTYMIGAPEFERWRLGNIRDTQFDLMTLWSNPDTYREFRDAPKECSCTAQNIMDRITQDERLACL